MVMLSSLVHRPSPTAFFAAVETKIVDAKKAVREGLGMRLDISAGKTECINS